MKRKLLIFLIIISMINIVSVQAEPDVASPSAILIDYKTGKVLYERNADTTMYPASTTKVMTGILALEHGKLDDIVTVGINPSTKIERGSSQIYLIPDERLTFEQLVYALMLESANDAAIAIAEHISGSVEEFCELMNRKAKELGAVDTNFLNPNGLHNDNHYSTARDLALIARYAMNNDTFRKVVSTYQYSIPATNKQEERPYIRNSNKLIWNYAKNSCYYEYATGIKTGYTVKSKHCLVASAKKDGMELIAVVLGTEKDYLYKDVVNMFEYGFSNFTSMGIVEKHQVITTITVDGTDKKINLLANDDFSMVLSNDEKDKITSRITVEEKIVSPVIHGQVLGKIEFFIKDKVIKSINLVSQESYQKPTVTKTIKETFSWKWIIGAAAAFLLFRALVTIMKLRKKRLKKSVYIKR
ncbi:MAG: D-alanyl-D-alanine carboxypeptidase family protein [Bacillota bacterium]